MAARITLAEVTRTLRALAEEHPDKVDERAEQRRPARYVHHGQAICLVAVVLHRLGVPITQLKQLDREGCQDSTTSSAGIQLAKSHHPAIRRIDPVARKLLDHVQRQQDRGGWFSWGRVIEEALEITSFDRYWMIRNPDRIDPWKLPELQELLPPQEEF